MRKNKLRFGLLHRLSLQEYLAHEVCKHFLCPPCFPCTQKGSVIKTNSSNRSNTVRKNWLSHTFWSTPTKNVCKENKLTPFQHNSTPWLNPAFSSNREPDSRQLISHYNFGCLSDWSWSWIPSQLIQSSLLHGNWWRRLNLNGKEVFLPYIIN